MKKRVLSFFIVIFIIFNNLVYVQAASDTTAPAITAMKWSATELRVGEELNIEIDAYDEETGITKDIWGPKIFIKHSKTGLYKAVELNIDEENNKLNGKLKIEPTMQSGEWELYFINIADKVGNEKKYNPKDFNQEYKFNLIDGVSDITPPIITDMKWSATELRVGDELNIEIDAYDEESGIIKDIWGPKIFIKHSITGIYKAIELNIDEENNKLNGKLKIESTMQDGEWKLYFINIVDKIGNEKKYNPNDFNQEYKFNLIDAVEDMTEPTITNMKWSATELRVGDELNIEIDAYDEKSGIVKDIWGPKIFIKHSITGIYKAIELNIDEENNKLNGKLKIEPTMQSGEWELYFINIADKVGNEKKYNPKDFNQEYKFNLSSSFNGIENRSIKKGEKFNPLEGVKAYSNYEGDFTNKITYSGNVNTDVEGIYLIKYNAIGNYGDVYNEYRWISVVSNLAYDENGEIEGAYFNTDVSLNLSNSVDLSQLSITKDGYNYSINNINKLDEEGSYKISFSNEGNLSANIRVFNSLLNSEVNSDDSNIKPDDFEFTIDKTNPKIVQVFNPKVIEGDETSADKFVEASDNSNKVIYEYYKEVDWNKVGDQRAQIKIKDLAGNEIIQEVNLNIVDMCDIDNNGEVSILDLASVSINYNSKESEDSWNSRLDFNNDGIIDIFDLVISSKRLK